VLVCNLAVLLRRSAGLLLREAPLAGTDTAGHACTQLAFRPVPVPPIFKGLRAGVPNAYTVTSGFSTAAAGQPQLPGMCEVVGGPTAATHLLLPGLLLQLVAHTCGKSRICLYRWLPSFSCTSCTSSCHRRRLQVGTYRVDVESPQRLHVEFTGGGLGL
jgi:hypothetical protein